MNKKNSDSGLSRRRFLRNSAGLALSSSLLSFGSKPAFGGNLTHHPKSTIPTVTLDNGLEMPMLGFGTNTLKGEKGALYVEQALSVGYRMVDTATVYGNEDAVGAGIQKSGVKREEIFLTSKLWVDDSGYESSKKAFQTSLDKLGTDYLDLYLYHRPRGDVKGSWKAMEDLHKEGRIRAIGISNFEPDQVHDLMQYATIKPAVNQIETHTFFQEHFNRSFLMDFGIQHEAWSPFAAGRNNIFSNSVLAGIGKKHGKSIAQVCLRWHYQRGIVAIPRSSNKDHMIENLEIFDFELDREDFEQISPLNLGKTQFPEWG